MNKYIKERLGYVDLYHKVNDLQDKDLSEALMVALSHQTQINYDALAAAYDTAPPYVQDVMVECGAVIVVTHDIS